MAIDSQPINDQMFKNKNRKPILLKLLETAAQIVTSKAAIEVWLCSLTSKMISVNLNSVSKSSANATLISCVKRVYL